ncbi:MAG: ABC transporter ATP-binding protein [Cyclobacteriaceae bacterium]|nr:ABC transporter ATP-binding protein [Cyclobacteriaceae bacterium]
MPEIKHEPEKMLLTTRNLSIGYTTAQPLFSALNLSLVAGELVCFMGPNGIGKSTLIKTLAGLQQPLHGTITIGSPQAKTEEKLSVVLTDRITATNMTVKEMVAYGRYPYTNWSAKLTKQDEEAMEQAIVLTRIHQLVDKQIGQLSDGQMQMVMIARALAQQTPLLLLDEPTAHLDLNNRVEIMNLLRELAHTTGKGILIATHELDLALQTADRIWLTGKEQNLLTGIPEDLVLDGSFDEIFRFKGFDLKTGKVFHKPWRGISIQVEGGGYELLWTKNALERNGFIVDDHADHRIEIISDSRQVNWLFKNKSYTTLYDLLYSLSQLT